MSAPLIELAKLEPSRLSEKDAFAEDNPSGELKWYFGYGSNLNEETFLGRRGIRPLDQRRLLVPGWRLTFDIAGIPYSEPGFGSIEQTPEGELESAGQPELQGMAYLVTEQDYQHIIATEGGNSAYAQIKVIAIDPTTQKSYKVWTLQAIHPRKGCQPSLRYISLIREGARQHQFPEKYQAFLDSVEYFEISSRKQRQGAFIFLSFWGPIVSWLFALRPMLTRPDGTAPKWLQQFSSIVFAVMWYVHDTVWRKTFGPGDHNR